MDLLEHKLTICHLSYSKKYNFHGDKKKKKPTSELLHEDTLLRLVKTKAHNVIIELLESALFSVGAYSLLSLNMHTPHKC